MANSRAQTSMVGGTTAHTPGPGAYQAEKSEVFPLYKYKQSSAFASKVDRQGRRMRSSLSGIGGAITHNIGVGGYHNN